MSNNVAKSRFKVIWVLAHELAVGTAPKKEKHLVKLKQEGIASILCLCREDEVLFPDGIDKEFNFKRVPLPDHRTGKAPTIEQLCNALSSLAEMKPSGPIFVHCVASMERSPLVCMAWLVLNHKLSPQESLTYLMQAHPGANPLPEQFVLLNEIEKLRQ